MQKNRLFLLLLLPFVADLFILFFLCFTENFTPKSFEHGFDPSYALQVKDPDYSKLDKILTQPFHYLGQGKQMSVFESEDGKYVLKFFNPMRPLRKKWYLKWKYWKQYHSLNWISREWFQKKQRLKKLFKRHQLAYDHLRNETGLIFVHLYPCEKVSHYVHAIDRRNKTQFFALNRIPFVLQEKATLVPSYLNQFIKKNNLTEAKQAVEQLEELFVKRLKVGITDRIQTMENNYGFVGNRPIQIDVGRIRMDSEIKENPQEEKNRILKNFQSWIAHYYPELK